jgi:hypothetical protein
LPPPVQPDQIRKRLEALRDTARDRHHERGARWDTRLSRFWNYFFLVGVVLGGLVATASGSIATQTNDDSWPRYAAIAGAVATACAVGQTKMRAVEKLKFANDKLADFEDVALRAENGLADGSGAELVNELTARLTEISRRELPD